jgi:hypothetical protein
MLWHRLVEDLELFYSFVWPAAYDQEDEKLHPNLCEHVHHQDVDLQPENN